MCQSIFKSEKVEERTERFTRLFVTIVPSIDGSTTLNDDVDLKIKCKERELVEL